MASFGCYDNSDAIATRIITNFHLYLIQLWWQFFQMFVYGVVVYAQKKLHRYWPWKTVSSHFHMLVRLMLLHRMALFSVRLLCKKLGNLQEFFWANGLPPPPLEKNCPYAYAQQCLVAGIFWTLDRNSRGGYSTQFCMGRLRPED